MGKYDGLRDFLRNRSRDELTLGFEEVGAVITGGLPASAFEHRAWWGNEPGGGHPHALAWLEAGYRTSEVNLTARRVTFTRRG